MTMLWNAGQARVAREGRERLAELFVAFRDAALDVLVNTGQAKPKGTWRQPPYIHSEAPQPLRSPAIRDKELARLGVMFPGMVRKADS
jgi:hypothetical protein